MKGSFVLRGGIAVSAKRELEALDILVEGGRIGAIRIWPRQVPLEAARGKSHGLASTGTKWNTT